MPLTIDPVDFRAKLRVFLREHTLDVLWPIHQGKDTQMGIAGELRVNRTTISRILTYLETEGYVASKPFRTAFTGRPEKKYCLTEKGEEFLQAVRAVNDLGALE